MNDWTAADVPDQSGKKAIITGANSGIGFETTKALAKSGAHVIMAARDVEKSNQAADQIRASNPSADLEVSLLDLASLK